MGGLITIRCCVTEVSTEIAVDQDCDSEDQPDEKREMEARMSSAASTLSAATATTVAARPWR